MSSEGKPNDSSRVYLLNIECVLNAFQYYHSQQIAIYHKPSIHNPIIATNIVGWHIFTLHLQDVLTNKWFKSLLWMCEWIIQSLQSKWRNYMSMYAVELMASTRSCSILFWIKEAFRIAYRTLLWISVGTNITFWLYFLLHSFITLIITVTIDFPNITGGRTFPTEQSTKM